MKRLRCPTDMASQCWSSVIGAAWLSNGIIFLVPHAQTAPHTIVFLQQPWPCFRPFGLKLRRFFGASGSGSRRSGRGLNDLDRFITLSVTVWDVTSTCIVMHINLLLLESIIKESVCLNVLRQNQITLSLWHVFGRWRPDKPNSR